MQKSSKKETGINSLYIQVIVNVCLYISEWIDLPGS